MTLHSPAARMDQLGREHVSSPSYGTGRQASGAYETLAAVTSPPADRDVAAPAAHSPAGRRLPPGAFLSELLRDGGVK